jgi:hypothetical protein
MPWEIINNNSEILAIHTVLLYGPAAPLGGAAEDEVVPQHQAEAVRRRQPIGRLQPSTSRWHQEFLRLRGLR